VEPQLYAHSRSSQSRLRHSLEDHLRGTAALARQFGQVFGAGDLAEYLALVHDIGKGCKVWQDRLVHHAEPYGKPVGVPHKGAGAELVDRFVGRPFAAAVEGHHGGLPNPQALATALAKVKGNGPEATQAREALQAVAKLVPQIVRDQRIPMPPWLSKLSSDRMRLGVDLLVRMLFSCLVDADYLDTEAHFAATPVRVAASVDMADLVKRFEERRSAFLRDRTASPVAHLRERVYQEAVAAAAKEPGMYVLHVPTGGAKTLAAGGFGLHHAAAHGMQRVIVAVPFTSITEQNAKVYRHLLDSPRGGGEPPVVLEHHSSVELDDEGDDVGQWARLAAENWDAPFVVTTTVQLFESLFARKPSAMRKLHHVAGSVVVLDEVQALPDRLLVPILSTLRDLVEHFGVTVVLASATQPEFWSLPELKDVPRRMVVSDTTTLFEQLRRVRYEWHLGEDVTWDGMAEEIASNGGPQVLSIVNTTKDAARLHRQLKERVSGKVVHLSTRMTGGHRREVIAGIRTDLKAGNPVQVVSTSLIEAGVDVDFPRVYRA
jgi:CRISPR-associated endonuclease/helicase Cas3